MGAQALVDRARMRVEVGLEEDEEDEEDEELGDDEAHAHEGSLSTPGDGEDRFMPVSLREQQYTAAWSRWVVGDPKGCLELLCATIDSHPGDIFAIKMAQMLCFSLGLTARSLEILSPAAVGAGDATMSHVCADRIVA